MDDAPALLKMLKKQVEGKSSVLAEDTLRKMKVCLTKCQYLPPSVARNSSSKKERQLALEAYELAVVLSVKLQQMETLERNFQMVKPFYFEYADEIGRSKQREEILGLALLSLLVQSRLAEFYSLLELLDIKEKANKYISFVVALEQFLMEGSYNKVLAARKNAPSKLYSWLLERLEHTVRDEVANCLEAAYPNITLASAAKLMKSSKSELEQYIETRENWRSENGNLLFKSDEVQNKGDLIPAERLVAETLQYANELERIV